MSTRLTIQPDQIFGAYRVERRLATNSVYSTFTAIEIKRERRVQINLCHDLSLSNAFVAQRLATEGRTLARLNNPFVRRLFSITEHEGRVMIIGAPEDGITLDHYLLGHVTSMADLIDMFRQMLEGLRALHDAGVLHRDLRPNHVIVGSGSAVRLTGFGLLVENPHETMLANEAEAPGQFNYLAPELLNGKPATRETDIYALGLVLYHLLTLNVPFEGQDLEDVREKISAAPLTFAPRLSSLIPAGLMRILLKMTDKNPASRYPDVPAVLQDLMNVSMDTLPVELRESNASGRAIVNFGDLRKRGEALGLDPAEFRFVAAIAAARPASFVSGENGVLISLATFLEAAAVFRVSKTAAPVSAPSVTQLPPPPNSSFSLANTLSGLAVVAAAFYLAWLMGIKHSFAFLHSERRVASVEAMIEPPRHMIETSTTPVVATVAAVNPVRRLSVGFNVHFSDLKPISLAGTQGDLDIWQSDEGRELRTQNPFLPATEVQPVSGETVTRLITGDSPVDLDVVTGRSFTNTIEPKLPVGAPYTITCTVGQPSEVKVPAGTFSCLRVECVQDGDAPSRTVYMYAPKFGYWVRSEIQPGGRVVELQNFGLMP